MGTFPFEDLQRFIQVTHSYARCYPIVFLDLLVELLPINGNGARASNADLDFVRFDAGDHDFDIIANPDRLANLPCKYQHESSPPKLMKPDNAVKIYGA